MSDPIAPNPAPLAPLPYHREAVAYLKEAEPELWRWASSAEVRGEYGEEVRTAMLKSHYRLDAEGHPELAARSAAVARRLGVIAPITLYQAAGALGLNAALCHLPGEAHIVFSGPILATLKESELDAVLAHELAHSLLWEMEDGDFLTADRILLAAANDGRASGAHIQTARRFRLYTEVFADRGSLAGSGDLEATVAALVKTETGLPEVSAASYLRQADEIFSRGEAKTNGIDHPETFIRARALRLWDEQDDSLTPWLQGTIEGALALDELDLFGQRRLTDLTRRFLGQLLLPRWFRTDTTLAHAQAFFPGFTPASAPDHELVDALRSDDAAMGEYLCFLLLDFVAADPSLEEIPLAAALIWSQKLGLAERFEKLVVKELGLGKRQLNKLKKEAVGLLEKAEAAP